MSQRKCFVILLGIIMALFNAVAFLAPVCADAPIELGNRRELFLDDYLIGSMTNVQILVHQPVRENIAIQSEEPWEGNGGGYYTVLYDDTVKLYRAYCHAWQIGNGMEPAGPLTITTYESRDGINWTRPKLGLCEFNGSKENNIILDKMGNGDGCHDFSPFIDQNPAAKPEERYKATGAAIHSDRGVWAYASPDGIHWKPLHDGPVFTRGAFDSQNISFWSAKEKKYILYYRTFIKGVRSVNRAVSNDYIHWTDEGPIQFPKGEGPKPLAQFYVNQLFPYARAPHLYIGFPARYVDRGITASTPLLPEWNRREKRIAISQRYGTAFTDSVYITSRDGIHFRQSNDSFLPPGLRTQHNWSYGDNYIAWQIMETKSTKDDMPQELSLYATESYFTGRDSRLRRYSLRMDGFASVHAKSMEGEFKTKPVTFTGKTLSINAATSAAGLIQVEILDVSGKPVPGYTLSDCDPIYGDSLDRTVTWKGQATVEKLAGRPVIFRFVMTEAGLYSMILPR